MNSDKTTDVTPPEMIRLAEEKTFWPKPEHSYLLGTEIDPDDDPHQDHRSYNLSINLSEIEKLKAGYKSETEDKIQICKLYHPSWSGTLFDISNDLMCDGEDDTIPLTTMDYSDNSAQTGIATDVNEIGAGVCPTTVELYCHFFNTFNFTDKQNQDLIYRVYTCKSNVGYKFSSADYDIPEMKAFIDHFETGRDLYHRAQLMQSLLRFSDFVNCQLLQDLASSRMAHYINQYINELYQLRDDPEALKAGLKPGTDMTMIKDTDDLIVQRIRQWLGEENTWGSYKEYSDFKAKIGWIKEEEPDAEWESIEAQVKKAEADKVNPKLAKSQTE